MTVYSVYIINKAGSLIFQQDYGNIPRLPANERIMLASMFHGLYAITSKLSPEVHSSGIEVLEADTFKIHCFQTLTGTKFLTISDPAQSGTDAILKRLYEMYADYVLKNPFYTLENPIRCELFDTNLAKFIEQLEGGYRPYQTQVA
eukprot:Opistho-2@82939